MKDQQPADTPRARPVNRAFVAPVQQIHYRVDPAELKGRSGKFVPAIKYTRGDNQRFAARG